VHRFLRVWVGKCENKQAVRPLFSRTLDVRKAFLQCSALAGDNHEPKAKEKCGKIFSKLPAWHWLENKPMQSKWRMSGEKRSRQGGKLSLLVFLVFGPKA